MELANFVSRCCVGEKCYCGAPAQHKVEETIFHDDPLPMRHPRTGYLCHSHFMDIMCRWVKHDVVTRTA
jgi:hypothetical protein